MSTSPAATTSSANRSPEQASRYLRDLGHLDGWDRRQIVVASRTPNSTVGDQDAVNRVFPSNSDIAYVDGSELSSGLELREAIARLHSIDGIQETGRSERMLPHSLLAVGDAEGLPQETWSELVELTRMHDLKVLVVGGSEMLPNDLPEETSVSMQRVEMQKPVDLMRVWAEAVPRGLSQYRVCRGAAVWTAVVGLALVLGFLLR